MSAPPGMVWIVGAGPGDPDLITVRGLNAIRRADVILHDRLIPTDLLAEAPPHAERIYVGKEDGVASVPQERINEMLVTQALLGREVVRLKGGDPFVFGRGAEEAQALAEAGIPFEIVPGITSAIAVPAAAGIPVSHRDCGSTITIVSAHRAGDRDLPWETLAKSDTAVFLMGAGRVGTIARRLIEAGADPELPSAAVRWGTTPRQQELFCSLGELPRGFEEARLGPPSVLVAGKVVSLAKVIRSADAASIAAVGGRS